MKLNRDSELGRWGFDTQQVKKVLKMALATGGELAELFFEQTDSTRIVMENLQLDRVIAGTEKGVGLRILSEGRSVYGYTTELTETALVALAQTLALGVQSTAQKGDQSLADWEWQEAYQSTDQIRDYRIQRAPQTMRLKQKLEYAQRADQAARQNFPELLQVSSVLFDSERQSLVCNSQGVFTVDSKTYLQMSVQVVGEDGSLRESAYESEGGFVGLEFFDQVPPEKIGAIAAQRLKILLSAVPAPSGTMPVVLAAEAGGTLIHEAVGHGLEADLACHGLSVYQGRLGQVVASESITVLDDGTLPGKRGSYCFDDEGTPSQCTVLIEKGVLKNYLSDRLSASKFGLPLTGNGRRESFRHKPIVRMTNTYLASGHLIPESILEETEWGVFVKAMGGGQVNTVTGDFVFTVTEGYLIHQGTLGQPIRGATLVGNGPEVLRRIDRLGHDLGFATGTCGKDGQAAPVTDAQPTLRVPALTVGGEVSIATYWPRQLGATLSPGS